MPLRSRASATESQPPNLKSASSLCKDVSSVKHKVSDSKFQILATTVPFLLAGNMHIMAQSLAEQGLPPEVVLVIEATL